MTTPDRFPRDPQDELRDCRNAIEVVDSRIVALLAQRVALALRAASAKRAAGLSLVDRAREAEVIDRVVAEGRSHDLPAEAIERVFKGIIDMSRRAQENAR
jgi:chorismate mutase/prephenate dehydratase